MASSGTHRGLSDVMYHIRNRVEELKRNPNAAKLLVLRVLCCVVFVAAAACTTALTYDRSKYAQYDRFISRFDSVSERALDAVVNRFRRMNSGIQELSSTYSHVFPNATSWPNVAWQGFIPTATLLSKFSAIQGLAILPLVQPAQGARFSEFLVDYYKTDPYFDRELTFREEFPNATIWYADFSVVPTARYPDHYGNTTASPHQILTPAAQYTFSALAGPHLLAYNVHSNPLYTEAIDNVINCVASHNYSFALESCGAISKFNNIADETDMMGIYIHPIFPAGNQSVLAGFATGTISWKALLTNVIPKDVSGIDCVIESDAGAFTFRIEAGLPHLIGQGDLHEDRFSRYQARSKLINARVAISDSISYTLSFYPTQELEKSFVNEEPLYAALFMLGTFLFCSALFAFYDRLTIREFDRNLAVLDTKRRFVRFISHEIRTPLNTVRLGMKLLEVEMAKFAIAVASSSPGNMISKVNAVLTVWKQLADEIIESSESAVEVLNDLLNYDKIEVGTLKLEFSTWDIRSLGERTVAAMQVQARQKDITLMWACTWAGVQDESERGVPALDCSLLRDDCTVIGDSLRMAQVLRNLISNALKFTPSGGNVSVTVSADTSMSPISSAVQESSSLFQSMTQAGTMRIAVKDSGAGLSPQQLAEICAEGVQFNANELQAGQGSGLGLFISKGIVDQHGGKLVVESEGLGKGVTFTIELPLFSYDALDCSRRSSLRSNECRESRDRTRSFGGSFDTYSPVPETDQNAPITPLYIPTAKRLLVVDDSAFNRKMVVRLLTTQDHTCEQAEDGEVAVRKYLEMVERGEPPDAILMDFEMPVLNGPRATARLRELGCECLILGVTGNVLPEEVGIFREHGADDVLGKPLVLETLTALLTAGRAPEQSQFPERTKPVQVVQTHVPSKVHPMEIV